MSSCPKRVCLCQNGTTHHNQCTDIDYIFYEGKVQATPGSKFNLSLTLVGDEFRSVIGNVYASSLDPNIVIDNGKQLQSVILDQNQKCTTLEYSSHLKKDIKLTTNLSFVFLLSSSNLAAATQQEFLDELFTRKKMFEYIETYNKSQGCIVPNLLHAPVIVNVTILDCPQGLDVKEDTKNSGYTCQCEHYLKPDYVDSCTLQNNTGVFYRTGTNWIGKYNGTEWIGNHTENSLTILVSNQCPFGYCRSNSIGVSLEDPDTQCALGRSGVLCGVCPPGFSLAIGSSGCKECPNNHFIALILVFLLAGVVLVLFIKVLDLTVARGTINGLLFYANVIWINQNSFFAVTFDSVADPDNDLITCFERVYCLVEP